MKKIGFLITALLILSSCATSYQACGLSGGYTEFQLCPDAFHVCFYGNGFTSAQTVKKYVLLRASEITMKNGYKYFIITDSTNETSRYHYSNTSGNTSESANTYIYSNSANTHISGSSSSSTYSGTVEKPALCITIKCFKEKPRSSISEHVYDAEFYWNANKDS